MSVTCGNTNHPKGAWHAASRLPYSWQFIKRMRRRANYKRWGCSCDRSAS